MSVTEISAFDDETISVTEIPIIDRRRYPESSHFLFLLGIWTIGRVRGEVLRFRTPTWGQKSYEKLLPTNFSYNFFQKNSAVCVRTRRVNVNTFSTTVKDEISEGW